jgi:hypothetical protein
LKIPTGLREEDPTFWLLARWMPGWLSRFCRFLYI